MPTQDDAAVGDVVEATPIDWFTQRPVTAWHWLLVEASDGTVIDGTSRLAGAVPPGELFCGEQRRPIDALQSLEGGNVSFELAALDAPAPPSDTPMWAAGVPVTGRELHIPTCPATIDEILATHAEARVTWETVGIDNYEFVIDWSPLRPAPTTYRVTVAGGQTIAIEPAQVPGEAPPPAVDQTVLNQVAGTIDEVFQRLESEILAEGVMASYHPELGYPDYVAVNDQSIGTWEFDNTFD